MTETISAVFNAKSYSSITMMKCTKCEFKTTVLATLFNAPVKSGKLINQQFTPDESINISLCCPKCEKGKLEVLL